MGDLLVYSVVWFLRKTYYFIRYRDKKISVEKEFEQRGNVNVFFLRAFTIALVLLIAMFLIVVIGRTIYDVIHHNHIY